MPARRLIDKAEVLRRYAAGETGSGIATSLGVSRQYIHQIAKAAGFPKRRDPARRAPPRPRLRGPFGHVDLAPRNLVIISLRQSGFQPRHISAITGLSRNIVKKTVASYGWRACP